MNVLKKLSQEIDPNTGFVSMRFKVYDEKMDVAQEFDGEPGECDVRLTFRPDEDFDKRMQEHADWLALADVMPLLKPYVDELRDLCAKTHTADVKAKWADCVAAGEAVDAEEDNKKRTALLKTRRLAMESLAAAIEKAKS